MNVAVNLQTSRAVASAGRRERRVTTRAAGPRDARSSTFMSRGAEGLKFHAQGHRVQHSRGASVTRCADEPDFDALTCVNDFPASEPLFSNDEEAIMAQLEQLRSENEKLAERLATVKEKTVTIQEMGTSESSPMGSMSSVRVTSDKVVETLEGVMAEAGESDSLGEMSRADELRQQWLHKEPVPKTDDPITVVLVSSEVAPWSKTGGLGDVAGALPASFAARGHRTMVIAPRYLNGTKNDALYEDVEYTGKNITVFLAGEDVTVGLYHLFKDGVDFVFIDHPSYHRDGGPYGNAYGAYGDNLFRFSLLSLVACEVPLQLELGGYNYGDKCVFMANDWHSSLVCVYVASKYRPYGVYKDARTVLCIHNMAHHGTEPSTVFPELSLPNEWYGCVEWVFPEHMRAHELDKGEAVNPLKGALVTCDRILTVSQGYAYEITTPEGGFGLDGLTRGRQHVLNGIVNGVDIDDWNPATDEFIPDHYWPGHMEGKAECKRQLQEELGLQQRPDVPLIGFIGRLDWQKGGDLIQDAVHNHGLLHQDLQLVMLGSGDPEFEDWMAYCESEHQDRFRGWRGFSVPVAHRIIAGCDIILMPSRFEPCGLNQLYAMRYGTVPVAHATGGLKDTIEDFNPYAHEMNGAGTGLTFSPFCEKAMMGSLNQALDTYRHHKDQWAGIQQRGMAQDFSWDRSASQYEQVFRWAMIDQAYA